MSCRAKLLRPKFATGLLGQLPVELGVGTETIGYRIMRHGGPPRGYVPTALRAAFASKRSGREIRVSRPNAITHC